MCQDKQEAQRAKTPCGEKVLGAGAIVGGNTAGLRYHNEPPTQRSVKQVLEQRRDEALATACAINQKLQSMMPDDLHMGEQDYERKYSLYMYGPF